MQALPMLLLKLEFYHLECTSTEHMLFLRSSQSGVSLDVRHEEFSYTPNKKPKQKF
jgi:hypothetical protein